MNKDFLYIDILGFSQLVREHSSKIPQIFETINGLSVHEHYAFHTIVFSDTIIVYNKDDDKPNHYYITYLIEFAQQLFYKLLSIGVYFKGLITYGEFEYHKLSNINAYWGIALIDTYNDEKNIDGFGLFIRKELQTDVLILETMSIGEKYNFIFLCQSFLNLYKKMQGMLPVDMSMFFETDEIDRIDEDLKFFRAIDVLRRTFPDKKIRQKYETVYNWYKQKTSTFFELFEEEGFLPFILNQAYTSSINPFDTIAIE